MFQPVIKWSGSKRSQANDILKFFPKQINTYYEPFCGGCSVLRALIDSDIKVSNYVCSDLNNDLINLWNEIKFNPYKVYEHYKILWYELNKTENKKEKRSYFEFIRKRLNENHDPLDFMFIMRTTTNGMPRYNSKGEFNNSFHITRNGINPETLKQIILEWSKLLNKKNVVFKSCTYENIIPLNEYDFVYLDPPYMNSKTMYFGGFTHDKLFEYLRNLKCNYALSFDGISGKDDRTYNIPNDLYSIHEYIKSGNSSFKRTTGKSKDSIVYESLYLKTNNYAD